MPGSDAISLELNIKGMSSCHSNYQHNMPETENSDQAYESETGQKEIDPTNLAKETKVNDYRGALNSYV